ncbi:MAG: PA14 domain-containing protein, partial [Anaerolineae bacterium]
NHPPNTPQPTSPGDWYVARDGRAPTLCWQNNGDPDGDAVQFFAEVFQSAVNAQSGWINDTCWRPATLDGRYYGYQWRVKARDSRGAESGWSTVWHFTIEQPPQPPDTPWQAQYWDNIELRGSPRVNTTESGLYFVRHWGWGNGPHGLPADYWSARFVKTIYFPGGYYRFHCHKDDACRLYIDGQLRIDQWWDSSFEGGDWSGNLSAGNHEIKVEYYEKTGYAALEVWWQGPSYLPYDENCDQNNAWCAEYYLNREVLGTAAVRRSEGSNLWFDWGTGGPASTFPTDNFSTRFRRKVYFTCGTYRFNIFTDDGVRFWVDDVQQLNEWRDQVASFSVDVNLPSDVHNLRVEHYEGGGGAALHFGWEKLADCAPDVAVDYASTHYVRPGSAVDPAVRVRVTSGYLDGGRGDHLAFVGGSAMGAASTQPVYGLVNEGSPYTFDVVNSSNFRMTAPSAEGIYDSRWRVKASGNLIGPEATVRVVVDETPPSIGIQNPAERAYLNSNTVTVQASPQDANGIDQVQFFVGYDDGSGWAWYNLGWDLDGSDGWNRVWDASGVPDQRGIAFYAYAWDRAGNGAGAVAWDVTLDRTPPVTAIRPLAATQEST